MLTTDTIGILLAVFSALCAAITQAVLSRPIINSEVKSVAFFTVVIGLVVSGSLALASEGVEFLDPLNFVIVLLFAGVGILQYGISRRIFYTAIKNLGANITAPIITITMTVSSVVLAMLILREQLTEIVAMGIITVLVGVLLLEGRKAASIRGGNTRTGYVAAITAGIIPAFTAVMISYGLSIYHFVIASVFMAFSSATAYNMVAVGGKSVVRLVRETPRSNLYLFLLAGIFAITTQLLRTGALDFAPVILVSPFLTATNLFIPFLTWRVAKDMEVFNFRTMIGLVIITAGLIIIAI